MGRNLSFRKCFQLFLSLVGRRNASRKAPSAAKRHHVVISGTGRAGTTFLIQLFTQLGFDTGFQDLTTHVYDNCNAGMEKDLRNPAAPHIVKDPVLCTYLDDFLASSEGSGVVIDHLIVPVRDLHSAAESRRDVSRRSDAVLYAGDPPGGVWLTDDPSKQEAVLQSLLYQIIFAAAKWKIPLILLHFPRIAKDPAYLFEELQPVLARISFNSFRIAFERIAKPHLIHDFQRTSIEVMQEGKGFNES